MRTNQHELERVASAVVVVGLIVAAVSLRSGGGGTAGSPNDAKALAQLKEYCNSTTIPLGTYANGESVRGMCYYCFGQTTGVSGTGPGCKPGETVPPPTDPALICGGVPAGPPLSPVTTMVDTPTIVVVDPSPNAAAESRTIDCLSRLSYRFVFAPPGSATRLPRSGVMVPPGGDGAVAQRVMDALGLGALSYDPQLVGDLRWVPTDKILAVVVLGDDAVQQLGLEAWVSTTMSPPTAT